MMRKCVNSVVWYEFEILQPYPHIHHGVCAAPFIPSENPSSTHHPSFVSCTPCMMNQVHGNNVVTIGSEVDPTPTADAMVTTRSNLALVIKHADCQPCLLFDPEHSVIGVAHSGWRSSCLNIYKATVEHMQSQFDTKPEQLLACIGPSLGPCHAEFIHWHSEFPASFKPFLRPNDHFDFWAISRHQLQACGIKPQNIEIAEVCTRCHPESFCSYRFNKTSARNLTFIAHYANVSPT